MKRQVLLCLLLLVMSYLYCQFQNDLLLLFIPLLSFVSLKVVGVTFRRWLTGLFLLFFGVSSVLLYLDSHEYQVFGVLSYIFFASIVIIIVVEYIGDKDDR